MKTLQTWVRAGWLLLVCGWLAGAGELGAKELVNVDKRGVAVQGYDVVAFFSVGQAVKGDAQWAAVHRGATYWFSSAEYATAFAKEPEKCAPAYGGFCAWAVSEKKTTAPVDVATWQIVDGRLILNYDADIKAKFDREAARHVRQADANWAAVVEKKGK